MALRDLLSKGKAIDPDSIVTVEQIGKLDALLRHSPDATAEDLLLIRILAKKLGVRNKPYFEIVDDWSLQWERRMYGPEQHKMEQKLRDGKIVTWDELHEKLGVEPPFSAAVRSGLTVEIDPASVVSSRQIDHLNNVIRFSVVTEDDLRLIDLLASKLGVQGDIYWESPGESGEMERTMNDAASSKMQQAIENGKVVTWDELHEELGVEPPFSAAVRAGLAQVRTVAPEADRPVLSDAEPSLAELPEQSPDLDSPRL